MFCFYFLIFWQYLEITKKKKNLLEVEQLSVYSQ